MTQLEALMNLGMTEEEARQVMEDDAKIEHGEKMDFDLTKEQEKNTRQYRQADRKPFIPDLKPRERKPNEAKRKLISMLNDTIIDYVIDHGNNVDNHSVEITNPERQIDFVLDGVRYRIVLSAPRK